jgi:hypothetical protein
VALIAQELVTQNAKLDARMVSQFLDIIGWSSKSHAPTVLHRDNQLLRDDRRGAREPNLDRGAI